MGRVIVSEKPYVEELATNQPRNLMVICERLFLRFDREDTAEEMAQSILEKLQDDPMLIGKMLRRSTVELLFDLWENQKTKMAAEPYLEELQQLRYLGFISLEENILSVNLDAKDIFYFSLKSRRMKKMIEKYQTWEEVIFGMLFTYGILDIFCCYEIFKDVMKQEIAYDELEEFIMIRMIFWQSGLLLRNQRNMRLYMASREVMDRNRIFEEWNQNPQLPFRQYTKEEYRELALGNGIKGWDGISEMFSFVLEKMEDDRYKAMMIMKSLILMIQNGESYVDIVRQYRMLLRDDLKAEKTDEAELCRHIKEIFYSIPVYGLKGRCRKEMEQGEMFHVIKGGKR